VRTSMIVFLVGGTLAVSGAALAQQAATTAPAASTPSMTQPEAAPVMSSKMHAGQTMPMKKQNVGPKGRSCFSVAMEFDRAMQQRTMGAAGSNAAQMYGPATQLRNAGMEQCHAGNVKAGRAQIQQAIRDLQS
jgi:hypothetical protein